MTRAKSGAVSLPRAPARSAICSPALSARRRSWTRKNSARNFYRRKCRRISPSSRWEGKFDDLVVYSDRAAKEVREAREVLLFGPIFGVLGASLDRGRVLFNHWGLPPLRPVMSLGAKREAVEWLRANQEKRQEFLVRIRERDAALAPTT